MVCALQKAHGQPQGENVNTFLRYVLLSVAVTAGCGGDPVGPNVNIPPGTPGNAHSIVNDSPTDRRLLSPEEIGAAPAKFTPPGNSMAPPDPQTQPPELFNPNGVNGSRPPRPIPGLQ